MGIRKIDFNLCTGCGICVAECPMDVIRMNKETNKAMIKYLRDCQSCVLCEMNCPEGAIYVFPVHENRCGRAWYLGG